MNSPAQHNDAPSEKRTVEIFDTSLRDGLQGIGSSTTLEGELAIARSLIDARYDVIEAGCAASSLEEKNRIKQIVEMANGTRSRIAVFAMCTEQTIREAQESLAGGAKNNEIALLTSVSDYHIRAMFGQHLPYDEATEHFAKHTRMAAEGDRPVHAYLEDATRASRDYLAQVVPALCASGATVISVPDTTGCINSPRAYGELIAYVKSLVPAGVKVSAHTHNDLGLAVANGQEAVLMGADRVEGTSVGWGERIGNMPLDLFLYNTLVAKYGIDHNIDVNLELSKVAHAVRTFIERAGIDVNDKQPLYGEHAFRTKAGIHQAKLLKDLETYFAIDPTPLGFDGPRDFISFGRGTGRSAFFDTLKENGFTHVEKNDPRLREAAVQMQRLAEQTSDGVVSKDVALALALNLVGDDGRFSISDAPSYGTLEDDGGEYLKLTLHDSLNDQEVHIDEEGHGGLIALACKGMSKLSGFEMTVEDEGWQSHNIGRGEDSHEFIHARMKNGSRFHVGLGLNRDTNKAGFQAVVRAFNSAVKAEENAKTA